MFKNIFEKFFGRKTDAGANTFITTEYINNPIEIVNMDISPSRVVLPHDIVSLYLDESLVLSKTIDTEMRIDRVSIFQIQDALGYKSAVCGVFGEKK